MTTTETPDQIPFKLRVKRLLLVGFGIGAGLAIVGALIIGGVVWWSNRPTPVKPWKKDALVAEFYNFGPDGENRHYDFRYSVTNKTDQDYMSSLSVPVQCELNDGTLALVGDAKLDELKVLAGRKVLVTVHLNFAGPTTADNAKWLEESAPNVTKLIGRVKTFVYFDEANKYELRLPLPTKKDIEFVIKRSKEPDEGDVNSKR